MKRLNILSYLLLLCTLFIGCTSYCTPYEHNFKKDENVNHMKTSIATKAIKERKMVILYDSLDHSYLHTMTDQISMKMNIEVFDIRNYQNMNVSDYDVILIGSRAINNLPSNTMTSILSKIDFLNKDVSFYYIDAFDSQNYENTLASYIHNGNILVNLGFNSDEISETELVNSIIDEWLTSLYFKPPSTNKEK